VGWDDSVGTSEEKIIWCCLQYKYHELNQWDQRVELKLNCSIFLAYKNNFIIKQGHSGSRASCA